MTPSYPALLERASAITRSPRAVLGIAGAPGAGKSTLAGRLAADLGVPVVPMDGFHLRTALLAERGLLEVKGAPDTFDVRGYVKLLRRLRAGGDVSAPAFDRAIDEPVEGAVAVRAADSLVITEGNYLLLADGDWAGVRPLLDECWFVEVDEARRRERLIARHVEFGRTPAEAVERVAVGSDAANATLIATTRGWADLVVGD